MIAIVEIAGKQYKVTPDCKIIADKLPGEVGDTVELDRVLMYADGQTVKIGKPTVKGAKVNASIEGTTRGKKVIVFKMKRRKGYRKKRGHTQEYTVLRVQDIATN